MRYVICEWNCKIKQKIWCVFTFILFFLLRTMDEKVYLREKGHQKDAQSCLKEGGGNVVFHMRGDAEKNIRLQEK